MPLDEAQKKGIIIIAAAIGVVAIIALIFWPKPAGDNSYIETPEGDEYLAGEYIDPASIGEAATAAGAAPALSENDCKPFEGENLDRCYATVALSTMDKELCLRVNNRDMQDLCLYEVAFTTHNAELCSQIIYGASDCYYDIALDTNNAELCAYADFEEKRCHEAFEAKEWKLCEKAGNDRVFCMFSIIEDNPELCNLERVKCIMSEKKEEIAACFAAGTEEMRCVSREVNKNPQLCMNMPGLKSYCYERVAIQTGNQGLCEFTGAQRETCYYRVAYYHNRAELCEFAGSQKDYCYAWVAFNTLNPALCEKAGSERESCLEDIYYYS